MVQLPSLFHVILPLHVCSVCSTALEKHDRRSFQDPQSSLGSWICGFRLGVTPLALQF